MLEPYLSEQSKYQIIQLLGKGSCSQVYLVREHGTEENYAMKVSSNKELLSAESKVLQKLSGGYFPKWKDYFEAEKAYLVMEYIEGTTLQAFLEMHGAVKETVAIGVMKDILQALGQLHHRKPAVLYRDLKPENIMIRKNGKICLIDLGGTVSNGYRVGSYGYSAPEQFWEGAKLGPESDLYAAGKVLSFLLTGKDPCQPPYDMIAYCEKDKRIMQPIFCVLQRSMAPDICGRYDTAELFQKDMEDAFNMSMGKKWKKKRKKQEIIYEKCIWKSEYQRIF